MSFANSYLDLTSTFSTSNAALLSSGTPSRVHVPTLAPSWPYDTNYTGLSLTFTRVLHVSISFIVSHVLSKLKHLCWSPSVIVHASRLYVITGLTMVFQILVLRFFVVRSLERYNCLCPCLFNPFLWTSFLSPGQVVPLISLSSPLVQFAKQFWRWKISPFWTYFTVIPDFKAFSISPSHFTVSTFFVPILSQNSTTCFVSPCLVDSCLHFLVWCRSSETLL